MPNSCTRLFFSILGRPADPGGLESFGGQLARGAMSRRAVENALRESEEAKFLASNPYYLLPFASHIRAPRRTALRRRLANVISAFRDRLRPG